MPDSRRRPPSRRPLQLEALETRCLLAGLAGAAQNPGNAYDVTGDLSISPIDALVVINRLNGATSGPTDFYLDVNGDGITTPIDALNVINLLNAPRPQVTFELSNDTDRGEGTPRDRATYDVSIRGRLNFSTQTSLFIGAGQETADAWIDASDQIDPVTGAFAIDDATLREWFAEQLTLGNLRLWFSPTADLAEQKSLEVELLRAPPIVNVKEASVLEDASLVLNLMSAIYAPDSDSGSLQLEILATPASGTLALEGNNYRYTPNADFFGRDEFVYEVTDGVDSSGPATLAVNVNPVNDPPVLGAIAKQTISVAARRLEVPVSVTDVDGDQLEFIAFATTENPLAEIRDTYGLTLAGDDYFNLTGLNEKWLFGDDASAYLLFPGGDLVRWSGSYSATASRESLIARLDESVYEDPTLLTDPAPERLAPVSVYVEAGQAVVVAENGVFGDVRVTLIAADGQSTGETHFTVTIDPLDDERGLLDQLLAQAASLEHEEIPGFIGDVEAQLNTFSEASAALLTDMLRQLSLIYEKTEADLLASQEWAAEETRLRQQEIDLIEAIEAELKILQSEYSAAWDALSERLDDAFTVDESLPPVFINGTDYEDPIQVRRGDTVDLDLRAIHPSHQPFYYFPDEFIYDEEQYGFLKINPQTGLFTWQTPSNAAGTYAFAVIAEVNGNNTARIDFEIEIISNDPAIGSLTVSPKTITDKGSDPITLTANGVTHPSGRVDRVMFYQDADGNGEFDEDVDLYLGRDEVSSDGWSWNGLPHPVANGSKVRFFAQAIYFTFSSANYSPVASVQADVITTSTLDIDLLSAQGSESKIGSATVQTSYGSFARYGNGLGARIYIDNGFYLQRLNQVNAVGIGTTVGSRVKLADYWPENYVVQADDAGNLTIVFSIGAFGSGPEGFNGSGLWMMRIDAQNKRVGNLIKLAAGESDGYAFAFAMNAHGAGVVAWKGYYSAPHVFMLTFSDGGANRQAVRQLDRTGGFHDGGAWRSLAVNGQGDFLLAWPDYAVRANVADDTDPIIIKTEYSPWYAALSDNGWGILAQGRQIQAIDPAGRLAGKAITTTTDTSTRRQLRGLAFTGEKSFQVFWSKSVGNPVSSYDYYARPFLLDIQTGLEGQAILVKNETSLVSGGTIELDYTIANVGLASSPPVGAAFYLSHDDQISSDDRLLGTVTTATGIAGESLGMFSAELPLPLNSDPFWNAGSTSLQLIMALPVVGHQMAIGIPFVKTELEGTGGGGGGGGGDGGGGSGGSGGGGGGNDTGPKYIRPDIAVDQIGYTSVNRSLDLMELIGRQFVSAARGLARQAPPAMADRIEAMAKDVEIRIDTFFLQAVTVREAREAAIAAAEEVRTAAISNANSQAQAKIDAERNRRDDIVDSNQQRIDTENAKKTDKVAEKRARLQKQLQDARQELASFEGASSSADATAGGDSFGLWKPPFVENAQKCAGDPVECGKKAGGELSEQFKKARDQARARLEPLIDSLEDALDSVEQTVQRAIDTIVVPFQRAIKDARDAFTKARSDILEARDRLVDGAESLYEQTIASLPDLGEQIENAKKSAIPALERAKDHLGDAIAAVRSPAGVWETAKQQLESIDAVNPFGPVSVILDASSITADIAQGVLQQVGTTLGPAIADLKDAGGAFSDWSKETGGKASDWTKESAGDVVQWVQENVGDLLQQEIIAYKVCTDFDLSFNLLNGSFYLNAKIGPGIEYDSRKLKQLLEGQFAFPDIDPIEASLKMYGADLVVTSNYDDIRDQQFAEFGPQNVYFASERLVEYLGVESAAEIAAEAFLTGGAAADDALRDLGEQLRLEMNDIQAWLELKGEQQISSLVPGLIKSLLTQTDFVSPHLELRWTPVTYRYELEPDPAIGKAIKAIAGEDADLTDLIGGHELGIDSPHAAFAIIWKTPAAGDPLSPEAIDLAIEGYLQDFETRQLTGSSLTGNLVSLALAELQTQDVPDVVLDVLDLMQGLVQTSGHFEATVAATLHSELGIDTELVSAALVSGNPTVDLSSSPAGNRLADFLDILTFGNRGLAELDEFTLNLSTFSINVSGSLCHQHSWGSVADIVSGLGKAIG